MRITFFNVEPWEKEYLSRHEDLRSVGAELVFVDSILDARHLPLAQDPSECISVFVDSTVDDAALAWFPNLNYIATQSTGYDHIDLAACARRGITVSNVPSYGEHTVAEYAFGLILALSRKIYDAVERIRERGDFGIEGLRGFDLKGKTLGVIGTGRIGRHVIRMAQGFSMNVAAFDAFPDEAYANENNFTYMPLNELLGMSDIITIHVPYTKETHHLLNAGNIPRIKKGAYLINTARGAVVETDALLQALASGVLGGAGLDVLEEEGVVHDEMGFLTEGRDEPHDLRVVLEDRLLVDMSHVLVTAHNAFNTEEALRRILDTTIENIIAFAKGTPAHAVAP